LWVLTSTALAAHCVPGLSVCRVLYVTFTAGYRHDSIPASQEVLQSIAARSGRLEVVPSEDLSLINADTLRDFDAVFFFTSGELPLTDHQKSDLLSFVREGGGFGGVHSATDTFYTWPEYGDLIGAYFDGHPWVQQVSIDVEDPDHPAMRDLAPSFQIFDEIYQLRDFSRERTRVLMTLDTNSVDLGADGVHRTDGDFALAWTRLYGQGRVFYTALGHFESTWRDQRFQRMLLNALLWMTGQVDGDGSPRGGTPVIGEGGVGDALAPGRALAPGAYIAIYGQNLTTGSTWAATGSTLPLNLVGTTVLVNGAPIPLLYASPRQVNARLPPNLPRGQTAALQVWTGGRVSNAIALW
jgi:uncharacterized protein